MGVSALGYIGLEVADLEKWRAYAIGFLGLMDASQSDRELRFRADLRAWRIAVSQGKADDLAFAGFEVRDAAALAAVCDSLKAAGFEAVPDAGIAGKRGVTGLARTTDPDGLQVEIYFGAVESFESPMVSPAGVGGFLTGDQGLGHIVLCVRDVEAAKRFYMDGLGFRLSDMIDMETESGLPLELTFLHCNPRHHTIALAPVAAPKRLNHFMLQVDSMEDVGLAYDRAERTGVRIADTLGRHTNDHMFSFYAHTPSGFQVEYGWGGRVIDENWTVVRHKKPSIWGHKPVGG